MNDVIAVLKKPVITERATNLRAKHNQYVFRVTADSTKSQVKAAVEKLFKVKVMGVNTMMVRGKFRRMGAAPGAYRSSWKKAIVRLEQGQEIKDLEEGK